ncbi:acetate--CoA ligase [Amphibacillus jilinensis]|uniref:acetate--CoA ligase n=1 Tax=Amphibacillus jilinensis TaxID=1216008 RepID=UPI0002D594F2|nr:acetate--CoA ligase [Amphibacillus jilinensis]
MSNILQPNEGVYQLDDYQSRYHTFRWEDNEWFNKKKINAAYETIDRHVEEGHGEKTALHYINQQQHQTLTFKEVQDHVDHYVQILRANHVKKGDRVFIFLPKNPDCYVAILATIRIGAIAGPLFEGFMGDAVHDRINDCQGKLLITDKELGQRIDRQQVPSIETVLYQEDISDQVTQGDRYVEWLDADDGMLIHYTSGSTGKPKGVLHAHRAVSHHALTGKWVLDIHDHDIYWCTSHPGWVTGSVYGLFAPWLNRATIVIQAGRFKAEDWYQIIEQLGVTIWYSAPTAFRLLMSKGDLYANYNLASLRHVLSVGEPLNPEVIHWAFREWHLRIHDTWWMTETGGHLIVNLPSQPIKPGSMGRPFPGIEVGILDEAGQVLPRGTVGQLAVKTSWPGLMKTIWNNESKYQEYFRYPGWYVSGDLAYQDDDGYVFFQGRNDDMINSSGERIGPFEVESSLIEHPAVAEAGVIGKPDPIRGEIVKAFITLRSDYVVSNTLIEEIRQHVRKRLAAHAAPKEIEVVDQLPKTKISGKILRRELKQREHDRISMSS